MHPQAWQTKLNFVLNDAPGMGKKRQIAAFIATLSIHLNCGRPILLVVSQIYVTAWLQVRLTFWIDLLDCSLNFLPLVPYASLTRTMPCGH